MNKLVFASVISEIQQSDIFMTVKARICEAPAANLNGARVTEAFIDEIVGNDERYVGLPLYADVRSLINGNYRRLGHLYDSKTGEFHSTQIGSFYQFEKEQTNDGCALIGYARIAKRNKKLRDALMELFSDGRLKFSFELSVGEYEELDDGTILIDASDSNYLEGTAIVTFPACEDAVALELVAQKADDNTERGETEMAEKEATVVETAEAVSENIEATEEVTEIAEEAKEVTEETAEVAEEAKETAEEAKDETVETPEEENAACKRDKENAEENAAVVIHETTTETTDVCAYDTTSGMDACQRVTVETSVTHVEEDAQLVETDQGITIAEEAGDGEAATTEPTPETPVPVSEPAAKSGGSGDQAPETTEDIVTDVGDPQKKTAEQLVAELAQVVEGLKNEIAELKERKVQAEAKTVTAEINPFIDPINTAGEFSLLQKDEKRVSDYSLLSKY